MIEIWNMISTSIFPLNCVLHQFMWYAKYVVIAIIKIACNL